MYSNTINKYYLNNAFFNKINPISKIILLILIVIISLISKTPQDIIITVSYIIIILIVSRVPLIIYLKSIWNVKILLLFIIIINLIFQINFLTTILIIYRILIVIITSTLLISTTPTTEITYGLEKLLKPFNRIIKIQELALMITLALRFIPSIKDQSERITRAISVRGVDPYGNFKNKITAISILILPMFTSAIQKSDAISDIMEVRMYNYNNFRTNYHMNPWQFFDTLLIIITTIILITTIII